MRTGTKVLQVKQKYCESCSIRVGHPVPLKVKTFETVSTNTGTLNEKAIDSAHYLNAKNTVDKIYCCPFCSYCE